MDHSFFKILRYHPDGSLDSTFADEGILTSGPSYGGIFALQADDKILIATESYQGFRISRFLPDGALDSSFGNSGKAEFLFEELWSLKVHALAIQSDGKILVAGGAQLGGF